ncbi:MAG: tRNA glutamyl-Q(34) synthetase GluQRS [Vulcanimicrobiota bacterium]
MEYRGRLAPTPSGWLHLGHAQTFWYAHQRCRARQGRLILRQEDLDRARCRPEFARAAEEDLRWLGLNWDEGPYYQSQRMHFYEEHFERLLAGGHIYPCSCSRKEVQEAQRAPNLGDEEPIYGGTCRQGNVRGEIRCWRFRVPERSVTFNDLSQGPQTFVGQQDFGDFVVWRPQAGPSYQLAVVVDDALMHITEVVRGLDLLMSTARQLLLYEALAYAPPEFYHCPLVTDEKGVRLAKRHDALALRTLRERGENPPRFTEK